MNPSGNTAVLIDLVVCVGVCGCVSVYVSCFFTPVVIAVRLKEGALQPLEHSVLVGLGFRPRATRATRVRLLLLF